MTPILGLLLGDYLGIAFVVTVVTLFVQAITYTTRERMILDGIDLKLKPLERKLDALLKHQGVVMPLTPLKSPVSPEVQKLARSPGSQSKAIELYREQNPEASQAEAKIIIEFYAKSAT